MAPAIGDYQPLPRRGVLREVRGWAPVRMDSPLEQAGFEPSVPLADQHPNYQVGLARYRRTGAG
jgi:hypothetical protein